MYLGQNLAVNFLMSFLRFPLCEETLESTHKTCITQEESHFPNIIRISEQATLSGSYSGFAQCFIQQLIAILSRFPRVVIREHPDHTAHFNR